MRPRPNPRRLAQEPTQDRGVEGSLDAARFGMQAEAEEASFLDGVDVTPTFAGYEKDRYQEHDGRIEALVAQFNADKAGFIGATDEQVAEMPDLDPALVKSWLIQETGGGDRRSRAAWEKDPSQVNVPGDWDKAKSDEWMGLSKPRRRNEGSADGNVKASIVWLARKGFSRSGKAPEVLQGGQTFGGWEKALQNYNGRGKKLPDGRRYREAYADQILQRAADPTSHTPIQLQ